MQLTLNEYKDVIRTMMQRALQDIEAFLDDGMLEDIRESAVGLREELKGYSGVASLIGYTWGAEWSDEVLSNLETILAENQDA